MEKMRKQKEDIDKPVSEHLAELRKRLIIIFLSIIIGTIILYSQAPVIIDILKKPVDNFRLEFAFFTMTGAFTIRLKLAFVASLILLSPVIYYQLMAFIGPGLRSGEKKLVYKAIFFIVPIFVAGSVFSYVFIVPKALYFLISYGSTYMNPVLSGEKYLSFIALLCILIGVVFTIPVILIFLGRLGILKSSLLRKVRRFIILTVLLGEGIIAADIMTFIAIGIPFIIVYEMSLWVVVLIEKRREKQEKVMQVSS